jgi:hypothetical protein
MRSLSLAFLVALGTVGLMAIIGSSAGPLFANKGEVAPHLGGVYGRRVASLAIFPFSDALRKSGVM